MMKVLCNDCKNYEPAKYPIVNMFFGQPFEYWLNLESKSHLTDEDSKHIKNLAKEMVNAYSLQHQDNTATKLINFINSLKGE